MVTAYVLDCGIFSEKSLFEAAFSRMSEQRQEKIQAFKFQKDRNLSLGAGVLLEYGLRERGLTSRDLRFSLNEHGKPYIKGADGVHFNLSHSGKYAVCVCSDAEIGVDIEEISHAKPSLFKAVCTQEEHRYLQAIADDKCRNNAFFRLWTAKESVMKCTGAGLSLHPKEIEIVFGTRLAVKRAAGAEPLYLKEYEMDGYKMTACSVKDEFAGNYVLLSEASCIAATDKAGAGMETQRRGV